MPVGLRRHSCKRTMLPHATSVKCFTLSRKIFRATPLRNPAVRPRGGSFDMMMPGCGEHPGEATAERDLSSGNLGPNVGRRNHPQDWRRGHGRRARPAGATVPRKMDVRCLSGRADQVPSGRSTNVAGCDDAPDPLCNSAGYYWLANKRFCCWAKRSDQKYALHSTSSIEGLNSYRR
jgi:hypothetical protein